ncbi:MAG: tolB protein precursor, partial [Bacteroidota bacterium]|nr:tolB protein precursor [Bacteroidota bacterium]
MESIIRHIRKNERLRIISVTIILATVSIFSNYADAQYFGRNKPGYRKFRFDVTQTPHFEIYHYLKNDSLVNELAQWSENWYQVHLKIFRDTFKVRNPILFYNNVPDFQQTNAVSDLIGNGTGGVTEELKDRVILPVATSLAQTDHVLGHELVHAFQYRLFTNRNGMTNFSINNIPLWMIEGMAEYLSIGSIDPHTSMWIRDALLNNDFPTLRQIETDPKYFPYRFGEAFWAMAGKTWGDTIFVPLLKRAAFQGFDKAAESYLKYNEKTLSGMWRSASEVHFSKYLKNKADSLAGKKIVTDKNAGEMNISPSISPDGKYIAFFSEKNIFTLDLYLADASSGK